MRWRPVGTTTWKNGPTIKNIGKVTDVPWYQDATGLTPETQYEYQACGKEASYSRFYCTGPSGGTNTTDPFTTPAGWISPFMLAPSSSTSPAVAIDSNGNAVFAWVHADSTNCTNAPCQRVQVRARSATGDMSAVQTISPAGGRAVDVQVAADPQGNAVFVWQDFADGQIHARARSATGALSTNESLGLAGNDYSKPQVEVDANGNSVFVWERWDGSGQYCCDDVETRARSSTGALSALQTLAASQDHHPFPQLAVDPNGNAVFAWERFLNQSSGCCENVQARFRSATGTLSPIQTLSSTLSDARLPHIAVDADGDAVVVWERFDSSSSGCCWRVQVRTRSATGSLGPIQGLSAAGESADPGSPEDAAKVAVDVAGDAVVVWGSCCPAGKEPLRARALSATGSLGPIETLSPDVNYGSPDPQVAVDASGDAVPVWTARQQNELRIQSRTRSSTGSLGPIQSLSATGADRLFPQVAVDPNGDAVAVWRTSDQVIGWRIEGATGP